MDVFHDDVSLSDASVVLSDQRTLQRIADEADPLGFLIRLANGDGIEAADKSDPSQKTIVYPTLDQRFRAHLILEKRMNEPVPSRDDHTSKDGAFAGTFLSAPDLELLREKLVNAVMGREKGIS